MFGLIGAGIVVVVIALGVYLGLERLGTAGLGLAALRTVGLGALVLLFFNPAWSVRTSGGPPVVLYLLGLGPGDIRGAGGNLGAGVVKARRGDVADEASSGPNRWPDGEMQEAANRSTLEFPKV